MRYVFIINPAAGKGNIQKELFEKINAYFLNKNADYAVMSPSIRERQPK